ncbi:MAG: hypothetical protein IKW22_00080 [Bacteroidaceae bacterium]|nr:hypothetical protein [Bacteroidaceae bacterium]
MSGIIDFIEGLLFLSITPALAAYAFARRKAAIQDSQALFVSNDKKWVRWVWLAMFFSVLFLVFICPIFKNRYRPEFQYLLLLLEGTLFYASYILVSFRRATPEEFEKAKAQGENILDMTKESAKSILEVMGVALLGILTALPHILHDVLNPVVAAKTIGNVTYKLIDTSLVSIAGGFLGLAMLAIVIFISAYVAGAFISIASVIFFFCITIIKFFKNRKEYRNIEQK